MLSRIIDLVFRNRLLVVIVFALCVVLGIWRMFHLPVDSFPDTTPVQVQVNAVAPALSPVEIEQQLTLPLELAISGLPGLDNVRSISKFGFAQIVATFDDATEIFDARQLVMERVSAVPLSEGIDPPARVGLRDETDLVVASGLTPVVVESLDDHPALVHLPDSVRPTAHVAVGQAAELAPRADRHGDQQIQQISHGLCGADAHRPLIRGSAGDKHLESDTMTVLAIGRNIEGKSIFNEDNTEITVD